MSVFVLAVALASLCVFFCFPPSMSVYLVPGEDMNNERSTNNLLCSPGLTNGRAWYCSA